MSTEKSDFVKQLEAKLEKWDAKVRELRAKADQADAEAREQYYSQLRDVEDRRDNLRSKKEEVQRASEESWKDIKQGAERALDEVKDAFDRAKSRF